MCSRQKENNHQNKRSLLFEKSQNQLPDKKIFGEQNEFFKPTVDAMPISGAIPSNPTSK